MFGRIYRRVSSIRHFPFSRLFFSLWRYLFTGGENRTDAPGRERQSTHRAGPIAHALSSSSKAISTLTNRPPIRQTACRQPAEYADLPLVCWLLAQITFKICGCWPIWDAVRFEISVVKICIQFVFKISNCWRVSKECFQDIFWESRFRRACVPKRLKAIGVKLPFFVPPSGPSSSSNSSSSSRSVFQHLMIGMHHKTLVGLPNCFKFVDNN